MRLNAQRVGESIQKENSVAQAVEIMRNQFLI